MRVAFQPAIQKNQAITNNKKVGVNPLQPTSSQALKCDSVSFGKKVQIKGLELGFWQNLFIGMDDDVVGTNHLTIGRDLSCNSAELGTHTEVARGATVITKGKAKFGDLSVVHGTVRAQRAEFGMLSSLHGGVKAGSVNFHIGGRILGTVEADNARFSQGVVVEKGARIGVEEHLKLGATTKIKKGARVIASSIEASRDLDAHLITITGGGLDQSHLTDGVFGPIKALEELRLCPSDPRKTKFVLQLDGVVGPKPVNIVLDRGIKAVEVISNTGVDLSKALRFFINEGDFSSQIVGITLNRIVTFVKRSM